MTRDLKNLAWDERGATALEYGFVVAVLALGMVVWMVDLRYWVNFAFDTMGRDIDYIAYMGIP